jgi:hypothetical protein
VKKISTADNLNFKRQEKLDRYFNLNIQKLLQFKIRRKIYETRSPHRRGLNTNV